MTLIKIVRMAVSGQLYGKEDKKEGYCGFLTVGIGKNLLFNIS
jgi:hypothetical protein